MYCRCKAKSSLPHVLWILANRVHSLVAVKGKSSLFLSSSIAIYIRDLSSTKELALSWRGGFPTLRRIGPNKLISIVVSVFHHLTWRLTVGSGGGVDMFGGSSVYWVPSFEICMDSPQHNEYNSISWCQFSLIFRLACDSYQTLQCGLLTPICFFIGKLKNFPQF